MNYRLFRLRENGAIIPKWQRATHRGILGQLQVAEVFDALLNRWTREARLQPANQAGAAEIPVLRDVQLIRLDGALMILSGIERRHEPLVDRYHDLAQTWWLEAEPDPIEQPASGG